MSQMALWIKVLTSRPDYLSSGPETCTRAGWRQTNSYELSLDLHRHLHTCTHTHTQCEFKDVRLWFPRREMNSCASSFINFKPKHFVWLQLCCYDTWNLISKEALLTGYQHFLAQSHTVSQWPMGMHQTALLLWLLLGRVRCFKLDYDGFDGVCTRRGKNKDFVLFWDLDTLFDLKILWPGDKTSPTHSGMV